MFSIFASLRLNSRNEEPLHNGDVLAYLLRLRRLTSVAAVVEFGFGDEHKLDFTGEQFAMLAQHRAFQHGLNVLGMAGGSNSEGTKGDHVILAPAYTATKKQIEKIAAVFIQSVEEILREAS